MIARRGSRWRVVVANGRDPLTRRRRQLSGSAATEAEAVELERELRRRAMTTSQPIPTVAGLVEEWWASDPRLAATTRANYRANLARHVLPVLGGRSVTEIRPRLVALFLQHLQRDAGLSAGSVRKVRTVLSSIMSYAVAMEYVDSNPVMKVAPPPLTESRRVAPTVEETAAILLAAERHDPSFLTFLWVAAEEGGRRGETLALRWGSVDVDAGVVWVDSSVTRGDDGVHVRPRTKTKRPRRVALSTTTLGLLAEHRRTAEELRAHLGVNPTLAPTELVFSGSTGRGRTPVDGRPWNPDSTTRRFRQVKLLAGVRPEIDLHGLRHTMITELLVAGVDPRTVMGRAGHTSESVTMGIYAKVRPAADAAAAELWGDRLRAEMARLRLVEG